MHGALLYDNYLFDVPAMLDLCLLYASSERRNLARLILNIIKSQPKYSNDLQSTSQMFVKVKNNSANLFKAKVVYFRNLDFNFVWKMQALKDLEQYFGGEPGVHVEPVKLSNICPAIRGEIKDFQLEDYILFLVDIVTSISSLLEILPSVLVSFNCALPEIE